MANTKDIDVSKGMKILLYGPSGTGKTELASTFPNPHFIDLDRGLLSLSGKDIKYITISAKETTDPDFLAIPKGDRYAKADPFTKAMKLAEYWANTLTEDDTLVVDSISFLNEYAVDYILKIANQATPRIQDWGAAQGMLSDFLEQLNDVKCNVIIIAHNQFVKDEQSGFVSWLPDTIGKLATKISVYFDEVYLTGVERGRGNERDKVIYYIETVPTRATTAKSRLGLPNRIDDPTYAKLIELRGKR
jgi:thymidine kinase